jgi:protein TonB
MMALFRLSVAAMGLFAAAVSPIASAQTAQWHKTRAVPIGSPADWFRADDYPPAARRAHQQGTVAISLTVDQDGKAVKCDVVGTSGFPLLDSGTCEIALKRARFHPIPAEAGEAVSEAYVIPGIHWWNPEG